MAIKLIEKNFKNKEGINLLKEFLENTGGVFVKASRHSWYNDSGYRIFVNNGELYIQNSGYDDDHYRPKGYVQSTQTQNGFSFDWKLALWNTEKKEYEYKTLHTIIWHKPGSQVVSKVETCSVEEYPACPMEKRFGFKAFRMREDDSIPKLTPWQERFMNESERQIILRPYYNNGRGTTNYVKPSKYMLIAYPQLETMYKIGFRLARDYLYINEESSFNDTYYRRYGRDIRSVQSYTCADATRYGYTHELSLNDLEKIFKPGGNPKEILGVKDKRFVELLKNVDNVSKMESYLTLINNGESYENMVGIIDLNMDTNDLMNFAWVMNQEFNGERVFKSGQALINYLRRIDMNEAIEAKDGLSILKDYLQMAIPCGIDPRIDSDSLKREHDVTARVYKVKKDEITTKGIESRYEQLKRYSMSDKEFLIRPIKSQQDLIDEATMQHNCVASYARRIANGETEVYVMRTVDNPGQSLITIEFCHGEVTQKYYSHNRRVTDAKHLAFIDKWAEKKISSSLKF